MTTALALVVEPMRWWDIERVAALEAELFPGDRWTVEQFWKELAQANREYLVVREGDGVVAYGGVMVSGADADIQTIAVDPRRQGGGLGRLLMDALLRAAHDRGATDVMLEVRAGNATAIGLYERFGFERLTTRRRYYPDGCDALIMRVSGGTRPPRQRHNGGPE